MKQKNAEQIEQDLKLVRDIIRGSTEAWQALAVRYAGLIFSVLRRYIFDEDDRRTVYVDILERLHRGKLATYQGRALLSTWLAVVARRAAQDFLRKNYGRRELPSGIQKLSPLDRNIFRFYYIDGMDFHAVRHWANEQGALLSAEELADILRRIDRALDDRTMRRIAYDLGATSVGAISGRMLEYMNEYRARAESTSAQWNPESALIEKEARKTIAAVSEALRKLPEEDRRVLELRMDRGWTAHRIAEELALSNEQQAFTAIRRGIRRLRRLLEGRSP